MITITFMAQTNNIVLVNSSMIKFFLSFLISSLFLILIHTTLSLFFEKQSISIVLALIGSFLGLVTGGMLPTFIKIFLPWQYYSLLNPVHKKMIDDGFSYAPNTQFYLHFCIVILLIIILLVVIKKLMQRRDLS